MNPTQQRAAVLTEVRSLAEAVCTGRVTPEQCARLNALLPADEEAALCYATYLRMHGLLLWRWRDQIVIHTGEAAQPAAPLPQGLLGQTWQGGIGFFSEMIPFSYLMATVITVAGLFGMWLWRLPDDSHQFARRPAPTAALARAPEMASVGRISGMADCRWADGQPAPTDPTVSLGRKYDLASGLLEISYETGAKVILQGPCRYEVESPRSGLLSLGKLTARVERSEVRGQGSEIRNQKSGVSNPQSPIPNPLFVVRTPTATVTDLGTEFGVEVSEEGTTTSHVFRGSIRVALATASGPDATHEVVLRENESARVERTGRVRETHQTPGEPTAEPVRFTHPTVLPHFVRRLDEPPKVLDVLDIVAGGNGTGHRRERGIDQGSGRQVYAFLASYPPSDHQYQRTPWHKLIDGVFVPDGGPKPMQLDSAGHTFAGFPATSGGSYGVIWSRAAELSAAQRAKGVGYWVYTMGEGLPFMPQGRGLLCLASNAGITLNLEAMRAMFPEAQPVRFRATAGLGDARRVVPDAPAGLADLWVLVDGRLKWKRLQLRPEDGPVDVTVGLDAGDRFLTLAVTDGGDEHKIDSDWVVFGDPQLQLAAPPEVNTTQKPKPQEATKRP